MRKKKRLTSHAPRKAEQAGCFLRPRSASRGGGSHIIVATSTVDLANSVAQIPAGRLENGANPCRTPVREQ